MYGLESRHYFPSELSSDVSLHVDYVQVLFSCQAVLLIHFKVFILKIMHVVNMIFLCISSMYSYRFHFDKITSRLCRERMEMLFLPLAMYFTCKLWCRIANCNRVGKPCDDGTIEILYF